MKIDVRPRRFYEAHPIVTTRTSDEGVWEAIQHRDAWVREVEFSIARELMSDIDIATGDHTYHLKANPLTVLVTDPTQLPPEPEFAEGEDSDAIFREWRTQCEPWGGPGIVESLLMYADLVQGKPFTVMGVWDGDEVHGLFGVVDPANNPEPKITVLFQ